MPNLHLQQASALALLAASFGMGALNTSPVHASSFEPGTSNGFATIRIKGTGEELGTGSLNAATNTAIQNWKLIAFPNDYLFDKISLYDKITNPTGGTLYAPSGIPAGWAITGTGVANTNTAGVVGCTSPNPDFIATGSCKNRPVSIAGDPRSYRYINYAFYDPSGVNAQGLSAPAGSLFSQSYFTALTLATDPANTTPSLTDRIVSPATNATAGACPAGAARPCGTLDPTNNYSYIIQTTFTAAKTGLYTFNTNIAADNFIEAYLGGSVINANKKNVAISGGIFLGQSTNASSVSDPSLNEAGLFNTIRTVGGTVALNAGQDYELNYVITDNWTGTTYGSSGAIVATTFFAEVPGPLPVLGLGAFLHQSRRLRRRIAARRGD